MLQFLPHLTRAGIEADVEPVPSGWLARRRLFITAGHYDLVFLQKRTLDPLLMWSLRRHARRLVFDVDDAIMCGQAGLEAKASRRRRSRFRAVVRAADAVFAGNSYLAHEAQAAGARVLVMPTVVDLDRYPDSPSVPDRDHFTLGWIGSRSTLPYLQAIAPAIDDLARDLPQLRLKVVCDVFLDLESVQVLKRPWSQADEVAELQGIDVGLMPLPDNAWTRGKCGFKILQYFAAWRPTICSPVGINAEIVTPGENGLFAAEPGEWPRAIRELAQAPDRCGAMGVNGRARVAHRYSLQTAGDKWVAALLELAA